MATAAFYDSRKACPEPFGYAQDKLRRRDAKLAKFGKFEFGSLLYVLGVLARA
jgi:hypothetical protein